MGKFEDNMAKWKKENDAVLNGYIEEIENNLNQDDGTYGLGDYLWENYIRPAYKKAEDRYQQILNARAAVNIAIALSAARKKS